MAAGKRTPRLLPQCLMSRTIEVKVRLQAMFIHSLNVLCAIRKGQVAFEEVMGEKGWSPLLDPLTPAVLKEAVRQYGEGVRFTPFGNHHSMVGYRRHSV